MNYLKFYQEKLGLVTDGLMGPKTAKAMMDDLQISNKLFFAHLMGQMKLESLDFQRFRENMNYSAPGLLNIFRKYYLPHPGLAEKHEHKPELIANYVYANRNGNGNVESGDGYKYRGAFGLQLTGKTNIQRFFESIGIPVETDPDSLVDNPKVYFQAGVFWFLDNHAAKLCTGTDDDCILTVGRKVNLGRIDVTTKPHGWEKRLAYTKQIFKALDLA